MARYSLYKKICLWAVCTCCTFTGWAQTGNKALPQKAATDTLPTKQTETIIIIDKKTGKPISAEDNAAQAHKPLLRPGDTTIIIIKNSKQKKELQKTIDNKEKAKIEIVRIPEECNCMSFDVKAPDTLRFNDYINYSFILKNNCKKTVWVNSASFTFYVSNPDGSSVRVLRRLQYVKQYKYPDFVSLEPGEQYHFDFGEDAFFQYELHTNWQYKFSFIHNNTTHKYKGAPNNTYLCNQFRTKMIRVMDRLKTRK